MLEKETNVGNERQEKEEMFTFRTTDWGKSDVDKELLGSSGVRTSSVGDGSTLGIVSIEEAASWAVDERDNSSELVSAKVTWSMIEILMKDSPLDKILLFSSKAHSLDRQQRRLQDQRYGYN